MAVLVRFEAFPEWFTKTVPGYRGLIPDTLLTRESWSRILIDGMPAGYSQTSLAASETDDESMLLQINNRVHLRILMAGQIHRILARTDVSIDREYRLAAFDAAIVSGMMNVHAQGRRLPNHQIEVTTTAGAATLVNVITIPPDALLYSPVQEMALRDMRPGSQMTMKTINPLTMDITSVRIDAVARETIQIGDRAVKATRLVSSWQGLSVQSWVDNDGLILRQETPLGWVIESCSSEEAMAALSESQPAPSLVNNPAGGTVLNMMFGKGLQP
ncbi:MAG TPA: hypothetical protein DCS43_07375 [Verrucomicrobia bacterium]|nr:hypothetical protein [Verrucomicrobiota bacterium]